MVNGKENERQQIEHMKGDTKGKGKEKENARTRVARSREGRTIETFKVQKAESIQM